MLKTILLTCFAIMPFLAKAQEAPPSDAQTGKISELPVVKNFKNSHWQPPPTLNLPPPALTPRESAEIPKDAAAAADPAAEYASPAGEYITGTTESKLPIIPDVYSGTSAQKFDDRSTSSDSAIACEAGQKLVRDHMNVAKCVPNK